MQRGREISNHFDVLVIGSGVAGNSIAHKCADAGLNTAIADYRPFGGTCAMRGCDPKKILVDTAYIADIKKRLPALITSNPEINWKDLISFKKSFTDAIPQKREESYKKANIAMLRGKAYFDSGDSVIINNKKYIADKIVIATGAKPQKLNIEGENYLITSDDFLELEELPEDIIFIGGGFISFEFAHIASRFGSNVKIFHNNNEPLNMFDREIVFKMINYSKDIGIDVILDSPVNKIEKNGSQFIVHSAKGSFLGKVVIHGAGRVADIDELNLEAANIKYGKGILVNDYMQSVSNEKVYAAGDSAAGAPPLTPVGSAEAEIAAENIIKGNILKRDFKIIPSTLYTIPPLAGVGLSEENAKKKGLDFKVNFSDTSNWYHSKKTGFKGTYYKVLIENKTDKIIGAYIFSPNAEDTVNLLTIAMHVEITTEKLKDIIFNYPSITSDIKYMI
ncbi:NAD(P)/FAD-dependent oxidoreductase [bacterium]|nr:NAD(P)/FAD-dependent oxidoreductase [bacterium]